MTGTPITVADVAAILGVHDGYIEGLLADGYLHLIRTGDGQRLLDPVEVEAYAVRLAGWQAGQSR